MTAAEKAELGGTPVIRGITREHRFDLDELLEAAIVSSLCSGDPRGEDSDVGVIGRNRLWTWNDAGALVDHAYGRGSVVLLRSLVGQFRLSAVDALPPLFFARILVLMADGVTEQDVSQWWEMRSLLRSAPLELSVAADAVTRWGVAFVNDCARAGLTGEDLRQVLANS